jgi:hypothetical protein
MKSTQIKFKAILKEYCDGSPHIVGMRAGIYTRHVNVSIDARFPRKTREIDELDKETLRMKRELEESFPHRKVDVRIGPSETMPKPDEIKPFQSEKIVYITVRPYKIKSKC